MQNDDDTDKIGTVEKGSETQKAEEPCSPIFSKEEIKSIVKGFISSFISGQIVVKFKSADEFINEAKYDGKRLKNEEALRMEVSNKNALLDVIHVCDGTKQAKKEEIDQAISLLFDSIMGLRMAQRISGTFYGSDMEARIRKLEEGLSKTNSLIEEFVVWVRQGGFKQ